MASALMPCGGCNRHVRASERSCPFCGEALTLIEPIAELRLLTRLDRGRLMALGALLSAAGIVLGCREQVVAVYGAPPRPLEAPSAAPSGVDAVPAPPSSSSAPPPLIPPSDSAEVPLPAPSVVPPARSAQPSPPRPVYGGPPSAVYGAPPKPPGSGPQRP